MESKQARRERLEKRRREIERELAQLRGQEKAKAKQADTHIKCVFAGYIFETQAPAVVVKFLREVVGQVATKHQPELTALIAKIEAKNGR
ncbi:hypothetical protein [Ferriphaselus sp. R-1]|uniref:hypothetical protein n=1 Tax=Ferriphaselus sp. R-1 TaxID=1485544 RepID=UPI0005589DD8|nr:hypothetical protein [Ferriphaselus sp. R-1]